MSLYRSQLAASLFPRLDCGRYLAGSSYSDSIHVLVQEHRVGGFVVFDGDIDTVAYVLAELQNLANGRLLFAADCEDGVTMRFPGGTEFPGMRALGEANDIATTYAVAQCIAREMRSAGLHWNFAPVVDVNTNPENPIINIRSFGETPAIVIDHAQAYMRGLRDGGVIDCVKHFPGHGDTDVDSHNQLPVLRFGIERLHTVELPPFKSAISNGTLSVMAAHIAIPAIDPTEMPASLSYPIITELLRNELGYGGIVVSDALDMHAITATYSAADAAVMAYGAGVDILELPCDPVAALEGLYTAAEKGELSEERIAESTMRIERLRAWSAQRWTLESMPPDARKRHVALALEAARKTIKTTVRELVSNPDQILVLAVTDVPDSPKPEEWMAYLSGWYRGDALAAVVTSDMEREEMQNILDTIDTSGAVVIGLFVRPRGFAGTVGLSGDQQNIVNRALQRPSIIANFGNPYLLREAQPNARIDTFSQSSASLAASIQALGNVLKQ